MAEEKTLAEVCRLNEEEQEEWIAAVSVERRIELYKEAMQLSLTGERLEGAPLCRSGRRKERAGRSWARWRAALRCQSAWKRRNRCVLRRSPH